MACLTASSDELRQDQLYTLSVFMKANLYKNFNSQNITGYFLMKIASVYSDS
jgi:hypothetical protein